MPLSRTTAAFAALVAVLVPSSCLQIMLHVAMEPDEVAVLNGVLKLPSENLAESVVASVAWTFAVTWALTILSGRFERSARQALRLLPLALAALAAAILVFLAVFLGFGWAATGSGAVPPVVIVAVLAALPLCYLWARFGLVLPIAVLDDRRGTTAFTRAWSLARGRTIALTVYLGFGLVAPALLATAAGTRSSNSAGPSIRISKSLG